MFLNNANENSANGIYAVNFFSLGVQNTVLIDDYLPSNSNGNPLFAKVNSRAVAGEQGSLWVPLMEKAFAKYHGNYLNIVGGDPADSLRTMNNSPLEYYGHKDRDVDEAWAYITSHIDRGQIVQVATPGTAPEEDFGLVNGHAYNTLGHVTLSTG